MFVSGKKTNLWKKAGLFATILIGSIMLGTIAMTLAYTLPTEIMERNVRSSIDILYTESVYPQLVRGYKSSQLDNETDSVMLLAAIYDGGDNSALEQAMKVERVNYSSPDIASTTGALIAYAWENKIPTGIVEYSRYWHGYMLWLKPLLVLLDYADIRMLNMMIQLVLVLVLMKNLLEKGLKKYFIPFVMALIVINPVATAVSMQFSSIYYLVLIFMILILKKHETWKEKKVYPYVFFILGILTVFFDFLTYPMAALCMPLILMLLIDDTDWKEKVKESIILGICFGIGYLGMWAGKWLVSSIIVTDSRVLETVMRQFSVHTGTAESVSGISRKLEAIFKNIKVLLKWPYLIAFVTGFICILRKINWKCIGRNLKNGIPYLCIALVPIAWIFFTSSHAYICYWYTYRGLMASVFAGYCILQKLTE